MAKSLQEADPQHQHQRGCVAKQQHEQMSGAIRFVVTARRASNPEHVIDAFRDGWHAGSDHQ